MDNSQGSMATKMMASIEMIEDSVITSVLEAALTGHLSLLQLHQSFHDESQPRRGKGVETRVDIARMNYYNQRTAAAETCLAHVDRIASQVKRWAKAGEHGTNTDGKEIELIEVEDTPATGNASQPSILDFKSLSSWQYEDDEPFLNPISGQWITPTTSRSAGPSGTQDRRLPEKSCQDLRSEVRAYSDKYHFKHYLSETHSCKRNQFMSK
jgi:hypothetical protein